MDADIPGLRAFVSAAQELHFGRAAARLFLTQQALSKRIRRLEEALGTPLFERTTRSVDLTAAGRRFLAPAVEALAAFDRAVGTVRPPDEPVRVDVYDERFTPLRMVREASERDPRLRVELSMRQGLAVAVPALRRQEIDAAFGRVHDLPGPWPEDLAYRLVRLEPLAAFVPEDHVLAGKSRLRPADLRAGGIAMPDPAGAAEWRGYLRRLADRLDVPLKFNAPAIGLRHLVEQFLGEKEAVGLGEMSIDPAGSGLRRIPIIEPVPLMPWSLVWHRRNRHPLLRILLGQIRPAHRPDPADRHHWIPEIDHARLG
ncbi:LysR family transcriptional regulator [Nonomuraea jiangxiensis]|uniref:DNA-binding transcriptional regulator, LysR family n=1 Tax=Nonomuraea jiangxiensis TaxID=633440 RepID=A0A1G8A3D3_9ACTN|nr:LysR family transcriptional regulator [Nonomuraea jiangxiensis]SDH15357.1 DNA-binding transcriptional regulator, LysR family [Nonomuraea jiangxiensis]